MSSPLPDTARLISKRHVGAWLARLLERSEVVAPTTANGGDVTYAPVGSPDEVLWDFDNPLESPKRFVLPQTYPVAAIRRDGGHTRVQAAPEPPPRVLFNLRSCDVRAITLLRTVHGADLPDAAFLRRLDALTLVSLGCAVPCELGFCPCCDAGPFLAQGHDLQLTDLGDEVLAEVGTPKGEALLAAAPQLFRRATMEAARRRADLEEAALRRLGEQTCHFASAMRRISTGRVAPELWEAFEDWCQECGGCNLVCPTCYCFSVKDRACDGGWLRCRTWDSCQYPAFTLEASGHNPRPRRGDRIRRRFFHKASAQYYRRDGAVGCVGCGRCIKVCLGTTDMPAVVAAIREGAWDG